MQSIVKIIRKEDFIMKGMTLRAICEAVDGVYHGDENSLDKEVTSITIDSRTIEDGGLFVAIKGERSDGHSFIGQCFDKGALAVISEHLLPEEKRPYIEVKSSTEALKEMALLYRNNLDIKVVGITGSVGKTSTKESIYSVLKEKYTVLKTLGNFNNEIGLPLTIFRLRDEDEIAVLEMGISDFGEMERLTRVARPDICVITNIGICHLENLIDRDGVLKAKTEIFKSMNPDGIAILNGDDDKLETVTEVYGKRPYYYGISNKEGVYADEIVNQGLCGTQFKIHGLETTDNCSSFTVNVPVPGHHMIYNAMAAATVGAYLGLTSEEIKRGINSLETIAGRNNIIKENDLIIIDDCYNANPISMKASIDVLDTAVGRKIAVLGDMFELGKDEIKLHYEVGMYLATKDIDVLLTAGKLAKNIADGARDYYEANYNAYECEVHDFETRDELLENIGQFINNNDNILVKASHGMEFNKVVDALKTVNA